MHSQVRGRVLGPHLLIDMRVCVDPSLSVSVAEQVATKVRLQVTSAVPQVTGGIRTAACGRRVVLPPRVRRRVCGGSGDGGTRAYFDADLAMHAFTG